MKFLFQIIFKKLLVGFFYLPLAVTLLVGVFRPATAEECCEYGISGTELMYFNRSLESFALGGSTAGLEMNPGNYLVNPATSATMLQKMIAFNLSFNFVNPSETSKRNGYFQIGYLHPTDYGVFGGYYSVLYEATVDFNRFDTISETISETVFSFGPVLSKEVNKMISLGMVLSFDYYLVRDSNVPATDVMPFGINAGFSANLRSDWNYQKGIFAIKDFIASAQIDQAGLLPWRRSDSGEKIYLKTSDLFKLGFGFTFVEAVFPNKKGMWAARVLSDIGLTYPIDYTYHVGLKNSFSFEGGWFRELNLMVGHYSSPAIKDPIPVTGGFGMVFMSPGSVKVEMEYAFGLKDRGKVESFHSLGFNIHFGEVDSEKPVISSPFGNEGAIDSAIIE